MSDPIHILSLGAGVQSDPSPCRVVAWFSSGAASAVMTKLALAKYKKVEIAYCNTLADEHPDNSRFIDQCSKWFGQEVRIISSRFYSTTDEVFEKNSYMSGVGGAKCTTELKKKPRHEFEHPDDIHLFGLTADEGSRIARFENNNPELKLDWILRDQGFTKQQCFGVLKWVGIELPMMYRLGYNNNNCLGCVKAQGPTYWNMIRRDFPDVFKRRAEQSRRIGCKLVKYKGKRIFLDELPANAVGRVKEDLSCGPQCGSLK